MLVKYINTLKWNNLYGHTVQLHLAVIVGSLTPQTPFTVNLSIYLCWEHTDVLAAVKRYNSSHEIIVLVHRAAASLMEKHKETWNCRLMAQVRIPWTEACVPSPLTFLHHPRSDGELGGVVGSSVAFRLPGLLLGHDQLFPLLDGHVSLDVLDLRLRLRYSLKKRHTSTWLAE